MFVRCFFLIKNKRAINELRTAMASCYPLWDTWFKDESCPLNADEIRMLRAFTTNSIMFYMNSIDPEKLIFRLKEMHLLFKDWVILKFICRLIALEKAGNPEDFATCTPGQADKLAAAKNVLQDLNLGSVRQLALCCSLEDLSKEAVFAKLVKFMIESQEHQGAGNYQ
ncbi:MAG: hypothetical protein V4635_13755 [Bacteroidota bacterium]